MGVYIALAGLFITFLIQFGGIVWFAATVRASVDELTRATRDLRKWFEVWEEDQHNLDRRVAILEDRQRREVV